MLWLSANLEIIMRINDYSVGRRDFNTFIEPNIFLKCAITTIIQPKKIRTLADCCFCLVKSRNFCRFIMRLWFFLPCRFPRHLAIFEGFFYYLYVDL